MLSLERCRQLAPVLKDKTDEEVREIRDAFNSLAELAFESWKEKIVKNRSP